jgi:hypothetical protein
VSASAGCAPPPAMSLVAIDELLAQHKDQTIQKLKIR